MVQRKLFARALSILMSATLCFPAVAAESTVAKLKSAPRTAIELQMDANGSIRGKVVDRQGKSLSNAEVKVVSRDGSGIAKTDAQGMFAMNGLTVGEYVIAVGKQSQKVRVWNAKTAPPNTAQAALLVVGGAVRAQCGSSCGGCNSCAPSSCGPAPSCGISSPVTAPCASTLPSCGPSCGGCNECGGGGCGLFGGGGGCFGGGGFGSMGAGPLLIGAGVAAAIAIPLALDDDDDDAS